MRFTCFRVLLGLHLAWRLFGSLSWTEELYGARYLPAGFLPANLLFPATWLGVIPREGYAFFLGLGALLSLSFAAGLRRRLVAPALFVLLWLLYQRNPLADSPELVLEHWFLLATCFVPEGEPWSLCARSRSEFAVPAELERSAWFLLAASYAFAGYCKLALGDPSWAGGEAVRWLLADSAPRRLWYGDAALAMPAWIAAALTYGALLFQLGGPLAMWHEKSRRIWWWGIFLMELASAFLLDLAGIVAGMLVLQLFLWNPFLIQRAKAPSQSPA